MIKRFRFLSILLIIILVPKHYVYADMVFGNAFANQNSDKIKSVADEGFRSKRFIANSPSGYIIPKVEPGSKKGISPSFYYPRWNDQYVITLKNEFAFINGELIDITHTIFHNGQYFGVMAPTHSYQPPGWVLMDELLLVFDRDNWEEKHRMDFYYDQNHNLETIYAAKQIVFWLWPGSDREKWILNCTLDEFNFQNIWLDYSYKDHNDKEWGKIVIKYSYRSRPSSDTDGFPIERYDSGWVYLSDPENSNIPAFYPAAAGIKWSPEGKIDWDLGATVYPPVFPANNALIPTPKPNTVLISILVTALCLGIVVVLKYNKDKTGL